MTPNFAELLGIDNLPQRKVTVADGRVRQVLGWLNFQPTPERAKFAELLATNSQMWI